MSGDVPLSRIRSEWAMHHLLLAGVVRPRGSAGSFHRSELYDVKITERVLDGYTNLALMHGAREIARARYRYDDSLKLIWEPLP